MRLFFLLGIFWLYISLDLSHLCYYYIPMIYFEDDDPEEQQTDKPEEKDGDMMMQRILKTRTILLSGEVNKALAERVVRQLILLEDMADDPIKIFIDSPGGDADAGYAIFDMIRFVKPQVYTIGMGLVASAGAIILLAASKERRLGLPNSHYLIHQPLSGMRGVATEIEIHAREIEKMRLKINKLISEETSQPLDKVSKDTDRDYWMNSDEAKDYGLICKVISKREEL
jgi:ATP-dependent Clp protease, protease subunit